MKKVRQGQTRWKVVIYEPGKVECYDDEYVAVVYMCRVTKVYGTTVYYSSSNTDHYIAGNEWFLKNTYSSHKTAINKAKLELGIITAKFL